MAGPHLALPPATTPPSPTRPRPAPQRPLAHLTRGSELAGSDLALFISHGALLGTGGNLARGTGEGWTGDFLDFLGAERGAAGSAMTPDSPPC